MHVSEYVIVASLAALAAGGCTDKAASLASDASVDANVANDGSARSGSHDGGAHGDAGRTQSADAGATIKLSWQVVLQPALSTESLDGGSDGADSGAAASSSDAGVQGVSGVEVCVYGRSDIPCVATRTDGQFTLPGLPATSEVAVTLRKAGYVPLLLPLETPNTDMDANAFGAAPIGMALASAPLPISMPVDLTDKGMVVAIAVRSAPGGRPGEVVGDIGAKVKLSPMTGSGPHFFADGVLVPSAKSFVGVGAFYVNLDPGSYEVSFDDPSNNCSPVSLVFGGYGYPASPTSVKFPIVAGYQTTAVGVFCTPK